MLGDKERKRVRTAQRFEAFEVALEIMRASSDDLARIKAAEIVLDIASIPAAPSTRRDASRQSGWPRVRAEMIRDNPRCTRCGCTSHLNVHHKVPLSRGGTNEKSNLIVLCPNHHAEAHWELRASGPSKVDAG